MKTTAKLFGFILVLLVLTIFTSCEKDEDFITPNNTEVIDPTVPDDTDTTTTDTTDTTEPVNTVDTEMPIDTVEIIVEPLTPKEETAKLIQKYNGILLKGTDGRNVLTITKVTDYSGTIKCEFDLRGIHGILEYNAKPLDLEYVINEDGSIDVISHYTRNSGECPTCMEDITHVSTRWLKEEIQTHESHIRYGQTKITFYTFNYNNEESEIMSLYID